MSLFWSEEKQWKWPFLTLKMGTSGARNENPHFMYLWKFIFRKRGSNSPQNVENKTAASRLGNHTSQRLPDCGNGWQYLWQEGLDLKPPFVWCPEVGNTNSRNAPSLVQISCNLWTEDFGPDIWVGLLLAEVYLTQIMSISLRLERWLYE